MYDKINVTTLAYYVKGIGHIIEGTLRISDKRELKRWSQSAVFKYRRIFDIDSRLTINMYRIGMIFEIVTRHQRRCKSRQDDRFYKFHVSKFTNSLTTLNLHIPYGVFLRKYRTVFMEKQRHMACRNLL